MLPLHCPIMLKFGTLLVLAVGHHDVIKAEND